ncbi:Arabinanase/levansucrase/invertase [Morchella conica CCBAS932]|uniref:Arabinanase/levansucrase/invertase n=1 Tax=Morchella conica CCBAS932 TaxID=1392247 RepID=A0A3N4KBE0_9PEZI|nr:Arabinanase/levansucrase/invertase [Morchella conica CCBAS932]
MKTSFLVLLFVSLVSFVLADGLEIVPGATWTVPNTGNHLQAHGGGIIKIDDTFYIVGENKTAKPGDNLFQTVACYKSKDLVQWEFVNDILKATAEGNSDLSPEGIIERPKVIYNEKTNKYVMWMHVDKPGYGYARAGVAWSDSVCGDYTYVASYRPLDKYVSRDLTAWVDDDGTGYLFGEDRPTGLVIFKLSDDFLTIDSEVYNFNEHIESPAIMKDDNGVYYVLGSQLTGWAANDNYYSTAENIAGPWSTIITDTATGSKTYQSQSSYVQRVGKTFVYMGDRWSPGNRAGLGASTYIWLPLELNTETRTLNLTWYDSWSIDPRTGDLSFPSHKVYEAETAELENGATAVQADGFYQKGSGVVELGGPENGKLTIEGITKSVKKGLTSILIRYKNDQNVTAYGKLKVGNQKPVRVAFNPTHPQDPWNSPTVNISVIHGFKFPDRVQSLTFEGLESVNVNNTADVDSFLINVW